MSEKDAEQLQSGGGERGLDLSSLFQGLLGEGVGPQPGSGSADLGGLGGLLGALLGQGAPESEPVGQAESGIAGLVEGSGISPSVVQAAISLVLGSLLHGGSAEGSTGGGIAALMARPGDEPLDQDALKATGLPQQLSKETGLDLPKAIQTIQQVLQWLRKATKPLGSASAGSSTGAARKRRRKPTAKKKEKTEASTAKAKPKRPKRSTGAAKAKPKARPKTTSSSTRPKAKPKKTTGSTQPRARRKTSTRSESVDAGATG
jgi:hypothetical protein